MTHQHPSGDENEGKPQYPIALRIFAYYFQEHYFQAAPDNCLIFYASLWTSGHHITLVEHIPYRIDLYPDTDLGGGSIDSDGESIFGDSSLAGFFRCAALAGALLVGVASAGSMNSHIFSSSGSKSG
jgi:hypothetical protein